MRTRRMVGRMVVLGCLAGLGMLLPRARAQGAPGRPSPEWRHELREHLEDLQRQVEELRERTARVRNEAAEQIRAWWRRKRDEWRAETGKVEPLGRSVRLEFSFQPPELPTAAVTVATTRYTVESHSEQEDRVFHIKVAGSLKPTDKPDGGLLLVYDAAVELGKKDGDFVQTLHANGGVLVSVGKSVTLASIGQYTLKVSVQPVNTE